MRGESIMKREWKVLKKEKRERENKGKKEKEDECIK